MVRATRLVIQRPDPSGRYLAQTAYEFILVYCWAQSLNPELRM